MPLEISPARLRLLREAQAMDAEEAKAAGALGYLARVMVQATMPHSRVSGSEFSRSNGELTVTILAPAEVGLPYGSLPRLLLAWVTSEAVRTRSPDLNLGPSLSAFMAQLEIVPTGGRWGSIPRLRDQMQRLFSSSVSCRMSGNGRRIGLHVNIARNYELWWDPKSPEQAAMWQSTVCLSRDFFEEIIERPVPIDMRALKALRRSPMALDIYGWLTHRMSYLRQQTPPIPWEGLQMQFGAAYALSGQGPRDFKRAFLAHLAKVRLVYPEVRVEPTREGLILRPSPTHVADGGRGKLRG